VLLTAQLLTSSSSSQSGTTHVFARLFFIRIMSSAASVPVAHLKRITAVVEAEDGARTQKELLPLMRASLPTGRASPPSEESIAETIRQVQQRVKHRHERERKREAAEAAIAEQAARAASTRARQRNSTAAAAISTPTRRQPKKAQRAEPLAQVRAEDRLVSALAELRARNAEHTKQQKTQADEDKKARAASKAVERKEKKEKEAQEKKENRERIAKQRADEQELSIRLRDHRARQSLEAAAKKHTYEEEQREAAARTKILEEKMEVLIDLETKAVRASLRSKRAREATDDESEEDKENVAPQSEWQV